MRFRVRPRRRNHTITLLSPSFMPWTILTTAIVSSLAKSVTDPAARGVAKVFTERGPKLLQWFRRGRPGDRYTSLEGADLLNFYRDEALSLRVQNETFTAPALLLVDPVEPNGKRAAIAFDLSTDEFVLPPTIDPYTRPILEDLVQRGPDYLFNGIVASLRDLRRERGRWIGTIRPASYFNSIATNFSMDHKPAQCPETLRQRLSGQTNRLEELRSSSLVNHLGVVCIVESADGFLVVQRRSRSVANRRGTLSASVSGVVEFHELARLGKPRITLEEVAQSALRESRYELGLRFLDIEFLGLVREFARGGKPELYFYCRSEKPFEEIAREWRFSEEREETRALLRYPLMTDDARGTEPVRSAFRHRAEQLLNSVGKEANTTLVIGILLLLRNRLGRD